MGKFIQREGFIYSDDISNAKIYECKFCLNFYADSLFLQNNIDLPHSIKNSARKRKSEFLADRKSVV